MYIDLFAGCGGLSLGLYNAGLHGLFAVEKNQDAFETLKCNLIDQREHFEWPEWLKMENIDINILLRDNRMELENLRGNIALVVGGPPCQGFSMAGKRTGDDIRNELSNAYIEFVRLVQPQALFFENVHGFTVGFKVQKKGKIKKDIPYSDKLISAIKAEGYSVASQLVDMSEYGVPQKRKRFILFAIRDTQAKQFFELLNNNRETFLNNKRLRVPVPVKYAIGDLERRHGEVIDTDTPSFMNGRYGRKSSNYQKVMRQNNERGAVPDSHRFANQKADTVELLERIMKNTETSLRVTPTMNIVEGLKKRGVTPLKPSTICPTLTSIPDDLIHYSEARILTVREHARIQSFPDDFKFKGRYTTGGDRRKIDVPRYTQVANAVPPIFAEQVGIAITEMLNEN
ncbi:MAG: DNA cytosine methyltransferase [Candidatus Symbiothrix sp.]|jgi:DNA (cytosine-5)-methyltransferase 1|nr:DNA cytosine methyltransferase [Candidatus Symbiothrix sp.]